jgi:hypothetical protein
MTADSPCGDWEPYKEEKCFKIFDKAGLQSYEDAEKTCQQQENGSSLITIRFLEEQKFISNLFKTQKVANDIWIGVKYTNNKYKWEGDSDLVFTNWEQGSPTNKTDYCVQMNSAETSFGKWSDVLCNRGNLVVCQKMQTWSLSHLQKILLNTIKNPFPIGFIYVQLPKEKSPSEIWPWMTWNEVSYAYAGVFFRVTGGEAASFGQVQEDNAPRLEEVNTVWNNEDSWKYISRKGQRVKGQTHGNITIPKTGLSNWIMSGGWDGTPKYVSFSLSGGEVRPRNMAIRIWKRTG